MVRSRRSVLRDSGAVFCGAAASALAGCPLVSGSGNDATGDPPDTWYADHLPAPADLGLEHYRFEYVDMDAALSFTAETGIDPPTSGQIPGIEPDSIDDVVMLSTAEFDGPTLLFAAGSFDPSTFAQRGAEVRGLSKQGTTAGYTLWGGSSTSAYALGAKQGRIVLATRGDGPPLDLVRTAIDTANGSATRYVAADPAVAALCRTLGSATGLAARRHDPAEPLDGAVGSGAALSLGEAETTVRAAMAFESSGQASEQAATDWLASTWAFEEDPALETIEEGTIVTAERTLPTDAVQRLSLALASTQPSEPGAVPQASFTWEFENSGGDRGRLTITMNSGEKLLAENLHLTGSGFAVVDGVEQTAAGPWKGTATGDLEGSPVVVAGDSVTVGVTDDYEIDLAWRGEPSSAILDDDHGPGA